MTANYAQNLCVSQALNPHPSIQLSLIICVPQA